MTDQQTRATLHYSNSNRSKNTPVALLLYAAARLACPAWHLALACPACLGLHTLKINKLLYAVSHIELVLATTTFYYYSSSYFILFSIGIAS